MKSVSYVVVERRPYSFDEVEDVTVVRCNVAQIEAVLAVGVELCAVEINGWRDRAARFVVDRTVIGRKVADVEAVDPVVTGAAAAHVECLANEGAAAGQSLNNRARIARKVDTVFGDALQVDSVGDIVIERRARDREVLFGAALLPSRLGVSEETVPGVFVERAARDRDVLDRVAKTAGAVLLGCGKGSAVGTVMIERRIGERDGLGIVAVDAAIVSYSDKAASRIVIGRRAADLDGLLDVRKADGRRGIGRRLETRIDLDAVLGVVGDVRTVDIDVRMQVGGKAVAAAVSRHDGILAEAVACVVRDR